MKLMPESFRPGLIALLAIIVASTTLQKGEVSSATAAASERSIAVVLVYHRFGPMVTDSMTVTTPVLSLTASSAFWMRLRNAW